MRYYYYGKEITHVTLEKQQNAAIDNGKEEKWSLSYREGNNPAANKSEDDLIIEEDTVYEIDRSCMRQRQYV